MFLMPRPPQRTNLTQALRNNRVYNWRQQMSASDCAKVETIAAPLMKEIGYELSTGRDVDAL